LAVTDLDVRVLFALYGGMHGRWAPLMIAATVLGAGWTALGVVPLLLHSRTRAFGAALTLTIVATAILVSSLKAAIGRVRPWLAFGLPPPIGEPRDGSFPSGHAAGSFCVAVFLALTLPALLGARTARLARAALVAGLLAVAALIALSRVYLGAHFPSDVVGGAILGALIGAACAGLYTARRARPR
jgi:undecaprenyl-diphosphatase